MKPHNIRPRRLCLLFVVMLWLVGCGGPLVVSEYGSPYSPLGPPYFLDPSLAPHSGTDFGGNFGDPAIAVADGYVVRLIDKPETCGNGLVIFHRQFDRYTIYCHLQKVVARAAQDVKRGELIGTLGDSGNASGCRRIRPCPIVHLELSASPSGHLVATPGVNVDPLVVSVGCFDPRKAYPTDRLVLTYPVRCKD